MLSLDPKNQAKMQRVWVAETTYHQMNDNHAQQLDYITDENRIYRLEAKHERAEAAAFDRYMKAFDALPKAEQRHYAKQFKARYGYTTLAA